ncbi:hypothetical protein NQ318_015555 [Aromia moschata]|uniref:Kazrin N-terminal domain-containing protein n=1 Tax=Aromia moschata TaxID=1265417 RepID=A0AAV8XKE1_9CUCU|nr:hypothetical protein NQ318_015555 [Aromia moschata]
MIGYGDRTRTQAEVVRLFQEKYPELPPISQGTSRERGHIRQLKKNPPNKLSSDQKLDVMRMLEENPHTSSRQTTSALNISHSSILRVLTKNQMHPYKLVPTNELTEDFDRRILFSLLQNNVVPTMVNLYPAEGNPQLPVNVRQYLHTVFPNRWIGRRGSIKWPTRSPPDLTPLDFFLWYIFKSIFDKAAQPHPLKADKRRLKAEKFDLLNQMKQLYSTLEDKEKELRDFIRSYGQVLDSRPQIPRVRDNETSLQQLSTEREERERERWSLLRHARDEAERSLSLAAQLNAKELQLQQAQEQLQEARRQLASGGCLSDQESGGGGGGGGGGGLLSGHHGLGLLPGDRGSCSADSGVRVSSDRESGATSVAGNLSDSTTDGTPTITVEGGGGGSGREMDAVSIVSSVPPPHLYQYLAAVSTKDCSPTLSPLNVNNFSRPVDASLSRSVEQLSSPLEPEPLAISRRTKQPGRPSSGRGGTWGSISRVFARSRHRNKASSLQETIMR